MGIFAKLFGSTQVIDAGIKAGDAIFFTDQEKANWKIRLLKAYEPFKIAQRWLAIILSIPFVSLHTVSGVQILAAGWMNSGLGKSAHEAALSVMEWNNETLGIPVAIVLGFYFSGGAIESLNRIRGKAE
jgi:hypothetical protein